MTTHSAPCFFSHFCGDKGSLVRSAAFALSVVLAAGSPSSPWARGAEEPEAPPPAREFILETTDGISLAVRYFPAPGDEKPLATVILIHDLGGSSQDLVPLATALQQAGCAVIAPDLRGHGQSSIAAYKKAAPDGNESKLLKLPDFKAMAVTSGGRIRGQSDIRGDIESVRNWIKKRADEGKLDLDRIVVVGSGLGAAVAASWTVDDAAWPPIASGHQGGDVKGLVFVDPAFITKGFSIGPMLASEPVKSKLPILILAGGESRDAPKIFEQLKRSRVNAWLDSRLYDPKERTNSSPAKASDASLFYEQFDTKDRAGKPLRGDLLAAYTSSNPQHRTPASLMVGFITLIVNRPR